jgi:hypothetical protein
MVSSASCQEKRTWYFEARVSVMKELEEWSPKPTGERITVSCRSGKSNKIFLFGLVLSVFVENLKDGILRMLHPAAS